MTRTLRLKVDEGRSLLRVGPDDLFPEKLEIYINNGFYEVQSLSLTAVEQRELRDYLNEVVPD